MGLAGELNRGSGFIHQGQPVRVTKKEVVAVGTHSHTKLKLYVKNVFTGQESIVTLGHQDRVDLADVRKKEAQVVSKANGKLLLMDLMNYETFEAEADEDLISDTNEGERVIFCQFGGKTKALEKA